MHVNMKSALVALVLLVAIFAAGCGRGGGDLTTMTNPTTFQATAQPSPSPIADTGAIRLVVDRSHPAFLTAARIVWYASDSALNYDDPWNQGFDPNRIVYGPAEAFLAGSDNSWTWTDIPAGHWQVEAWLIAHNGFPIGRYVWLSGVDVEPDGVTMLQNMNWATEPGRGIAMPVRPITWDHQNQQPLYDSLAETRRDLTGTDPLITAGNQAGFPSVYLVERTSSRLQYIDRYGQRSWQITGSEWVGPSTTALTTLSPWSSDWQYFARVGRRGIARFGVPWDEHSVLFNGPEVVALDGAAGRIVCLYRAVGNEQYRIRVTGVGNHPGSSGPTEYDLEADFGLALSTTPTCVESSPTTERFWVGTREGGLYCFDRRGRLLWEIAYAADRQGLGIASLAMTDDRFLAVAFPGFGEVRFVDTRGFRKLMGVFSLQERFC